MTARIVAFVGPSMPPAVPPGIEIRPPATAGDLLTCLSHDAHTIVLVDGVFDARAAPRHKEVLMLLAHGRRVIGAASMGALRAAELDVHGMLGIGRVYEAYRRGLIVGDDEVALLHMPVSHGSGAVTEPLVNVRATLTRALRERLIARDFTGAFMRRAASIHFTDREWPLLLQPFDDGRHGNSLARLAAWLPVGRVDVKREDACRALAEAIRPPCSPASIPPPPRTVYLERLAAERSVRLDAVIPAAGARAGCD
jgi:hypothetical protein